MKTLAKHIGLAVGP